MSNKLEELIKFYSIQQENVFQEYRNKAILAITAGKKPQDGVKILSIAGGQSGAGKSRLIPLLKKQFEDSVVVDFDELRSYHPSYDEVSKIYPEIIHRILQSDTERVKNEVLDYLIANEYSTIYEGALRNTQGFIDFAKKFKNNGYYIQMNILAVPKLESYGSTLYRYAAALMTENQPRWVEKTFHDASYDGVIKTVSAFINEGLAEEFRIYIRDGKEPSKIFPESTQYHLKDPIQAIEFGRELGRRKAVQDYPQKRNVVEQILKVKEPETLKKLAEWHELYQTELEYFKELVSLTFIE